MTEAAQLNRLRWHSRRGLLELDLVLERFWARHGESLSADQARDLEEVLALEENDLWDIICARQEIDEPRLQGMIELLREP
jgi:antitoxin CptB